MAMRKNRTKRMKNQGFSLTEVLVAIIVLALVITPILQSFISTAKINKNSREVLNATDVGDMVMEVLTGMSYEDIKALCADGATEDRTPVPSFTAQQQLLSMASPSMDNFVAALKANYSLNPAKHILYFNWQDGDSRDCSAIAFHNMKYENKSYDVAFYMTPSASVESGDNYYTYDIELRVYRVKNNKHYVDQVVTIRGAIANQK